METCKFQLAWIGKCKNPANSLGFCTDHIGERCVSCGQQATHQCSETGFGVCGASLCDQCSHTLCENGCNEGVRPPGYNYHCKTVEQAYKAWFMPGAEKFNLAMVKAFRDRGLTTYEQVRAFISSNVLSL